MVEVELLQTKTILSNFLINIFRAIFHPMSDYAVRDSSLVKRIIQTQAFFSMKGLVIPAGSSPTDHKDCHFREESLEKVIFSISRGELQASL